ncbi:MAG: dethiobiotin synthase [Coxiella sp. RIFCSPHIGHO2_12_FULL_42_15]|nr:MAG: dethiobiotin synthase [Coxiella sp. RIFCSPHIGHO2_12_FULL_42_15]
MKKIFVAGTDTHVGKTTVACALLHFLKNRGHSVLGVKPVASGCELTPQGLRNSDALQLQSLSSFQLPYETINPMAFRLPIAPHIAAQEASQPLSVAYLQQRCQPALSIPADFTVIEGAGGWLVPLNQYQTLADVVIAYSWPVILVVGIKLGCLNHALLTTKIMQQQGVSLMGWVANHIDPVMPYATENVLTLQAYLSAPCLGVISHNMVKTDAIFNEKIAVLYNYN